MQTDISSQSPSATASASAVPYSSTGQPPTPTKPEATVGRSLMKQAYIDTLASRGARFGLLWLGLLVILAVFSPFIATSHPILMKKADGALSSPVLRYLNPSDVMLLIAFATVVYAGFIRRWNFGQTLGILIGVLAVAAIPCYRYIDQNSVVDYGQYERGLKAKTIQWTVAAPIPYSPIHRQRGERNRLQSPNHIHWLGTDNDGIDVLSIIIHASRIALSIGFISTGIAAAIGIVVGGIMGYFAGIVDLIGMRLLEILEAIPRFPLLLAITAFMEKRNIYIMMIVLGLTGWFHYARYLRAEFFTLRKLDFVQAAIAVGLPRWRIVYKHMLVNALTPILVNSTFGVAGAILAESVLTFLGLGLVDEASWGGLLQQSRANGSGFNWWIVSFPGLAIFLTVFSYNLVGEAIRDALDPRLRKRD